MHKPKRGPSSNSVTRNPTRVNIIKNKCRIGDLYVFLATQLQDYAF